MSDIKVGMPEVVEGPTAIVYQDGSYSDFDDAKEASEDRSLD